MNGSDDIRAALERELYWLSPGEGREPPTPAQQIRVTADRLAQRLRRDAEHTAPWGDPGLARSRGFRRRLKILLHRLMRPISRRYDRITAELAFISTEIANLALQTEEELRSLRQDLAALEERLADPESARPPEA